MQIRIWPEKLKSDIMPGVKSDIVPNVKLSSTLDGSLEKEWIGDIGV